MKMALDRRKFLILSASLGASVALYNYKRLFNLKQPPADTILGGGQAVIDGELVKFLALVDLKPSEPQPQFYRLSFLPHGLCYHPQNPHLIALFEKKGPLACEFDLQTGHIVRTIATDPTRFFYGHGVYSGDGQYLYSTETILSSEEGVIVKRNSKTMQIEGFFPTYGANPHDCQLIENGTVLAITNGGRQGDHPEALPCVSYVDIKTEKLIQKYKMLDPQFNTGHLTITQDKQLIVASAPHPNRPVMDPGALSFGAADGTLKNLNTEAYKVNLKSETLSVCVDEVRGVIAATSPAGNVVSFWNLKTKKLISSLNLPNPRGIILTSDNGYYAISCGKEASLILVDAETRTQTDIHVPRAGYSGSHLYILNS